MQVCLWIGLQPWQRCWLQRRHYKVMTWSTDQQSKQYRANSFNIAVFYIGGMDEFVHNSHQHWIHNKATLTWYVFTADNYVWVTNRATCSGYGLGRTVGLMAFVRHLCSNCSYFSRHSKFIRVWWPYVVSFYDWQFLTARMMLLFIFLH